MNNVFYLNKIESLCAVDGPGLRYGIFLQGCPLRCQYCHNPETQEINHNNQISQTQLLAKIKRYKPYFSKNGGVTFSGGEPLLQAKSILELTLLLEAEGINIAIDTSACLINPDIEALIAKKTLFIVDIKMLDNENYQKYIGTSLDTILDFLNLCQSYNCPVWLSFVPLKDINTSTTDLKRLAEIINQYPNIERVQIHPYHTLGVHKYKNLKREYQLPNLPEQTKEEIENLKTELSSLVNRYIIIQ